MYIVEQNQVSGYSKKDFKIRIILLYLGWGERHYPIHIYTGEHFTILFLPMHLDELCGTPFCKIFIYVNSFSRIMCAIQRQLSCRLTAHIMSPVAREEIQWKTKFPERKIDLTDTNNEILTEVKRRANVSVSDKATKDFATFNVKGTIILEHSQ